MDRGTENHVLENADKDGDKEKCNNQEKYQKNVNTNENQENANDRKEKSEGYILEEEDGEESGNVDNEEYVPSLPPDLFEVSEEIDEFISIMSNSSKGKESSPPDLPISVEQFTVLVEALIDEYDSSDDPVKWDQLTDEDVASLLGGVDRMAKLLKALSEYSSEYKYAYSLNNVGGVLQRAMAYLEEEFRDFLEYHQVFISGSNYEGEEDGEAEPEPDNEKSSHFCGYSEEVMSNLYKLVNILIAGGHEKECCQIYFIARRDDLEGKLHKHEFEKHSVDDVQKMNWESLEKDIISWNETVKQFTSIYFLNEHKLSVTVFKDHPSIAESLFSNLAKGIIIQLFNFASAIAMTKRAPEKLFKYLDVYESLRDLQSKMEDILSPECSNELKFEATQTRGCLGEAMFSIFFELENLIMADSGKTVPGGAVHPLTHYTMNYLEYACEYKDTLEQIFRELNDSNNFNPSQDQHQNSGNDNNIVKQQQSPFESQLVNVMDLLHENIVSKSTLYKDHPLSIIFLMNNSRHILQKIKACGPINGLLNDTWCRKRSSDLRQYHQNYQRETWNTLLNVLVNHEGLLVNGKVLKPVLKERFKSFNAMFEEILKTQSTYVISDERLKSELRVSITNMVVPAYRSFMGRFSQTFTPGRQTHKYVKFQPEDVEAKIEELFDGNASSSNGKRR